MILARKAVSLDRGGAIGHTALGRALMAEGMGTGNFEGAISSLEHAVSINANTAQAHYMLGRVLVWSGDVVRGRVHLEAAIRLSPRDPYLGLMIAGLSEAAFLEKDFETSNRWMEKGILEMPALTWVARCSHVAALAHLDRRDDAKAALEAVSKMVPDFGADLIKHKFKCAFQGDILSGLAKVGPEQ